MQPSTLGDATQLLRAYSSGDTGAIDRLMPLVYQDLRVLAGRAFRRERRGHSLDTTGLVHEAYLRLVDQREADWRHRTQFFAVAAQMMRRILVDHARKRYAAKRGGKREKLPFAEMEAASAESSVDLVALDDALRRLAEFDPQQARIVELRYFAGLTIEDTAALVGVSPATIKREWTLAKAWLRREVVGEGE